MPARMRLSHRKDRARQNRVKKGKKQVSMVEQQLQVVSHCLYVLCIHVGQQTMSVPYL